MSHTQYNYKNLVEATRQAVGYWHLEPAVAAFKIHPGLTLRVFWEHPVPVDDEASATGDTEGIALLDSVPPACRARTVSGWWLRWTGACRLGSSTRVGTKRRATTTRSHPRLVKKNNTSSERKQNKTKKCNKAREQTIQTIKQAMSKKGKDEQNKAVWHKDQEKADHFR